MHSSADRNDVAESRIKVVWFITSLYNRFIMGGTLGRIVKWYNAIDKSRYEVHILFSCRSTYESALQSLKDEYAKIGISVDFIPGLTLPGAFLPSARKKFLNYVDSVKPDIFHTLFIQSDIIGAYYKKRMHVASLISSLEGALYPEGDMKSRMYGFLYSLLRNRIDAVIALCSYTREQAVSEYGVRADRCRVIHSGIDPSPFRFPKVIRPATGPIKIGFLGYIGTGKRIDLFIDAVPQLLSSGRDLQFIVGGIGDDLERIKAKTKDMGLDGPVEFRGYVRDVPAFYEEIDILVFLSEGEGLPWVILESQSAGVPTVASAVSGVPEVIVDGENGLLLTDHSVDVLCRKVNQLIDDTGMRELFSRNARKRIEERFGARTEMGRIEDLYESELRRVRGKNG